MPNVPKILNSPIKERIAVAVHSGRVVNLIYQGMWVATKVI